MSEAQAREILAARGKVRARELAGWEREVNVWTVKPIWRGQTWKHIREEGP